jgi:hypothetical protein
MAEEDVEDGNEQDDRLATIKKWFRESRDHGDEWRQHSVEWYGFVADDQWDAEDTSYLIENNRPVITFNRIGPIIDAVCGMEVNNRQQVKYIPREVGDSRVNEILTGAADWVRDECDAEDEESDAFRDTAICGMGWTETALSYDEDTEGKIVSPRVDPLEMYWDPQARARNLTDRRYHIRVRDIELSSAEDMFPDALPEDLHAGWANDSAAEAEDPHINNGPQESYTNKNDLPSSVNKSGKVRIVQCEYWEREEVWLTLDPMSGKTTELSAEDLQKARERMKQLAPDAPEIQATKTRKKVFHRVFAGNVILKEDQPCPDGFCMQCITGKRDRNTNTWYGLVQPMVDPQRWANKWLSQTLHIMNSNAKGGVIVDSDAVDNQRKFEESWADPQAVTFVRQGGAAKIQPKPQTQFPQGMDQLMQFAITSIPQTTGVSFEFVGNVDREQAGIVEQGRQKATISVLAWLFDSMRRYRKLQGRTLLYFIQKYLPPGKLVRIESKENAPYVPLAYDKSAGKYDVVVDQAPTSPNNKEDVWNKVIQMLPMLQKTPIPNSIWASLVRYSPLPTNLSEEIVTHLKKPQGPSPEEKRMQAEMAQKEQEAKMDLQAKQQDLAFKQEMAKLDFVMKQQEMQLAAFEARLKQQELMTKANVTMAQADKDMQKIQVEAAADSEVEGAKGKAMAAESSQMAQTVAEAIATTMGQATVQLGQIIAAAMNQPKKLVRDEQGRAAGVVPANGAMLN